MAWGRADQFHAATEPPTGGLMERGIPLHGFPGQSISIAEQETLHPAIISGGYRLVQRSPIAGVGLKSEKEVTSV